MTTRTREIALDGRTAEGVEIDLPGAPLVLARGARGFVMCGFLDIRAADKFNAAAAIVRGVRTVDDLLNGAVVEVSRAAGEMGVRPGVSGRDALRVFSAP